MALNPNDAIALGTMGVTLTDARQPEYGRQLAEKALALAGPAAPRWWWGAIGDYHHRKGEYGESLEAFRKAYDAAYCQDRCRSSLSRADRGGPGRNPRAAQAQAGHERARV